jgi:hypothetical protein
MEAWNHFNCGWNANPMNMFRKIAADTFNPVLIHDMNLSVGNVNEDERLIVWPIVNSLRKGHTKNWVLRIL